MHGDVAYCRKHGHDYRLVDAWTDSEGFQFWLRECQICGYKDLRKVWSMEDFE